MLQDVEEGNEQSITPMVLLRRDPVKPVGRTIDMFSEAAYEADGMEAALAWLDRMEAEVEPIDVATAYVHDATLHDARMLREAIRDGSYNKYTWDPLLTRARPGLGT